MAAAAAISGRLCDVRELTAAALPPPIDASVYKKRVRQRHGTHVRLAR
jgi:hypothetical protein